ncbi:hypothetical protein NM688_g1252 [Phlebia brevispora]|uniref:Uncharacterized protein n=1 Tax=Phlebia brevispora TaxID=194682 RepID=A0ACC1TC21_9APHY|nr:hypothetical protein NM688_g1252 [Phlebia brevispora]
MAFIPFSLLGIGASMAAACTHPLDLTKVRMQTMATVGCHARPSMLAVMRTTIMEAGVLSLYTGLSASILRQMTYTMIRLSSYDEMKAWLSKHRKPSTPELFGVAMFAGVLGGIAGNPADVLLVRMTSDSTRPPEQRYNYRNALSGCVELAKKEGFEGLTRGMSANLTRAVLMNASQVGTYDFIKTRLLAAPVPVLDYQFKDNLLCHATASCLAGTIATTVCSPADVMRSRLMSASGKQSPIDVLRRSLREEGPRFLFKGWTPAFVRLGPNTILLFVFYEQLKKGWRTLFPSS